MRLVLIAAGGGSLGVGHLARVLALAEQGVARDWDVRLVGDVSGPGIDMVGAVPGLQRVQCSTASEAFEAARSADIVHIDSYDQAYDATRIPGALISSMADGRFGLRAADLVIDASLAALRMISRSPESPRWLGRRLLGPSYTPLRRAVTSRAGSWNRENERVPSILMVMGGTDPMGLTLPTLSKLAALRLPYDVTVVAPLNLGEDLERAWAGSPGKLRHEPFVGDLMSLAARHTITISASGTSVWEFAIVGAPMALVCAVPNQSDNYRTFTQGRCSIPLDEARGWEMLVAACADPTLLQELSAQASKLIDGFGAWRITSAWEWMLQGVPKSVTQSGLKMNVRSASIEDAALLLGWRNDVSTLQNSRVTERVELVEHLGWLGDVLESPRRHLLIVEQGSVPVATVRWDRMDEDGFEEKWEVSITVGPQYRGAGLAGAVLLFGERWLCDRRSAPLRLLATIHQQNFVSVKLFRSSGYFPDQPIDERGFLALAKTVPFVDDRWSA